ncbi:MAG: T9SS type A sorting domain-containing protein [Melioribacteraceae bacterium]|nr:T9SS type A sorting domain-containing protein [Melioribacteraceae bacterium]
MKKIYEKYLMTIVTGLITSISVYPQSWQSSIVYTNENGQLQYIRDKEGNCVPDFSYAGYKNGNESFPSVPVVKTISPVEGDNTSHINNAIIQMSLYPVQENGFRGALLLEAGKYEIKGRLYMKLEGIVVRGAGDGDDPATNTILYATGNTPSKRTVLTMGGGSSSLWRHESGSRINIISDTVLVGEKSFEVEDASPFSVGDNIIVYHPCTEEWLAAVDYGGTHSDESGAEEGVDIPWEVDSQPLIFNRYITAIAGNRITVDVPIYNHLIRSHAQSYIYLYSRAGMITHQGLENIRIDIETSGDNEDENHAWNAVDMYLIEDAWIKDCTMLHFGLSAVRTNTASRITVENCNALDPVSTITGGNRYNFQVYTASQQILFKDCLATNGRHHYVSNGMSWTSGIVFYNCKSSGAYTSSEGHRRWSMGMLWDNLVEIDGPRSGVNARLLGLYNRGYYGTSHGWAVAHSVAWNCDMHNGDLVVQKPPTAQNYAIGCSGKLIAGSAEATFDEPAGYIEGSNTPGLTPHSLYMAQLEERIGSIVSVKDSYSEQLKADDYKLYDNYPNPFNPSTVITYKIPAPAKLKITVIDILGSEIKVMFDGIADQGLHSISWDGTNSLKEKVNTGIYICILESEYGVKTNKMVLIK